MQDRGDNKLIKREPASAILTQVLDSRTRVHVASAEEGYL